jgi:hypothetical protein
VQAPGILWLVGGPSRHLAGRALLPLPGKRCFARFSRAVAERPLSNHRHADDDDPAWRSRCRTRSAGAGVGTGGSTGVGRAISIVRQWYSQGKNDPVAGNTLRPDRWSALAARSDGDHRRCRCTRRRRRLVRGFNPLRRGWLCTLVRTLKPVGTHRSRPEPTVTTVLSRFGPASRGGPWAARISSAIAHPSPRPIYPHPPSA